MGWDRNPLSQAQSILFSFGFLSLVRQILLVEPFQPRGWDWISSLDRLNASEFRQVAWPLVQMSANAYRYPRHVPVEGWEAASLVLPLAPLHGGAHAVVYEETEELGVCNDQAEDSFGAEGKGSGKRVVVAFRGTDLSGDEGSLADRCADFILFGNDSRVLPMPRYCSKFSKETLDYFSQALSYTRRVMAAYPDSPLLLTGHSLGATLSVLVSAALSEVCVLPVVAFSAGGGKNILSEKSLVLEAEKQHKVFIISNEWDEVMRTSWEKQVGTFCYYEMKIPLACEICFQKTYSSPFTRRSLDEVFMDVQSGSNPLYGLKILPINMLNSQSFRLPVENLACLDCFMQTHYLKRVMSLVAAGTQPVCIEFQNTCGVNLLNRKHQIWSDTV